MVNLPVKASPKSLRVDNKPIILEASELSRALRILDSNFGLSVECASTYDTKAEKKTNFL